LFILHFVFLFILLLVLYYKHNNKETTEKERDGKNDTFTEKSMKMKTWVLLVASASFGADAFVLSPRRHSATVLSSTLLEYIPNDAFIPLLHSYSKEDTLEAAQKAKDLLEELRSKGHELTTKHYTIVMDAFGRIGATAEAEQIYESMSPLPGNKVTWNVLLLAHVRAADTVRAEHWFQAMGDEANVADYNILLSAYARDGNAAKAEQLIKVMVDGPRTLHPTLLSYNLLLEAHSKREGSSSARAVEIWKVMEQQGRVNARTFAAVVQCMLHDQSPEKVMKQAEEFYRIAKDAQWAREDTDMERLQTALLDSYVAVAESHSAPRFAEKSQELLTVMEQQRTANLIAYNKLLKIWKMAGTVQSVVRGEAIMAHLRKRNLADRFSYTTMMGIYAGRGNEESAQKAKELMDDMIQSGIDPKVQTYNNLVLAWARSGNLRRAEQLLESMEQEDNQIPFPNAVTYATIMDGWCKSKDDSAAMKCEAIFERQQRSFRDGNTAARPNLISYVTLMSAHASSNEKGSAQRAQDILFDLFDEYKHDNDKIKLTAQTVATVMDAWQRSGERDAGENAEALLNWMISTYQDLKDENLRPNEFIFGLTISAWSRSRKFGKMNRARQVLDKMIQLQKDGVISASPNAHCYGGVINA
jgi:pentatricopeptide repeat protein